MRKLFIGISGIIGAGKTTLATKLGEHMGLQPYYEPVEQNEYLADFYLDTVRYAFTMQVALLNKRFKQHQQIIWKGEGGVQDRTIYEDTVFARMLWKTGVMDQRDYETYTTLFDNMANFMRKPDIIVFLDVSPQTALTRIHSRGRHCEHSVTIEYLSSLQSEYYGFIADIGKSIPIIQVKWDSFKHVEQIADLIRNSYSNFSYLSQRVK